MSKQGTKKEMSSSLWNIIKNKRRTTMDQWLVIFNEVSDEHLQDLVRFIKVGS
jgi:hypothetical protein